ncbi:methyltransferase domain-containing protein [Sporichthya sp.]|uniref:class I SAM-dependent methyltransferase n=1 Tax=Sporichthya sp. TaxID=65475 RepID=UPI0018426ADE|nr:methyltransferase domain-containing protein [Sporichthya sp.]MBA3743846.1 methyltransferase domain-containing protein [Sporichthya sp.]
MSGEATLAPAEFKACCAAAYGADWLGLLLGESYHPGGLALTRRLVSHLNVPAGGWVLDVASGRGASALAIAGDDDRRVCGVDLSEANVLAARAAAAAAGVTDRVEFRLGDAEALPVTEGEFDALICECALCTFPDKATAVAQMARALRPGGRVGITDVTAEVERLPDRLRSMAAQMACIGATTTVEGYRALLADAGMAVVRVENHDDVLVRMVEQIEARLHLVRMLARNSAPGVDPQQISSVVTEVKDAIARGLLGYTLIVARTPGTAST